MTDHRHTYADWLTNHIPTDEEIRANIAKENFVLRETQIAVVAVMSAILQAGHYGTALECVQQAGTLYKIAVEQTQDHAL